MPFAIADYFPDISYFNAASPPGRHRCAIALPDFQLLRASWRDIGARGMLAAEIQQTPHTPVYVDTSCAGIRIAASAADYCHIIVVVMMLFKARISLENARRHHQTRAANFNLWIFQHTLNDEFWPIYIEYT